MNATRRKTINFCFGFATFFVFHLLKACDFEEESLPPEVATPEKPAISPSKKYFLIVIKKTSDLSLYFEILEEKSKKIIHLSKALFAYRFTTFFLWDKDDRVWVYSGDIGTFFWEQNPETKKWEQYSYSESNATAPDFLQKVRPTYFSVPLEVATLERPAISPSGKYILAVISEWHKQARWLRFKVLNQKKQVLYTPPERFAARRITHILWDRHERIWVSSYSTAYFWERKKDNDWVKYKYNTFDDKVPKPDFLEWLI